ncbi:MAG TPA: hypothetical protein VMT35_19945 [Ignavibacteriaceae bacterium]|nr:hypothetical protein [Ignavibacteriaceae bacterium]
MIYKETQKFRQTWLWVILGITGLIVTGIFAYGFYIQIIEGEEFGNNPMSDNTLIIVFISTVIFFILLFSLFVMAKLITVIDQNGIEYRFFPFHLNAHRINWEVVERYEVVKYNPVLEYGGWGIRYGFKGKAYNVSGNKGLRLFLKNGRNIILGTQRDIELTEFLRNLFDEKKKK